MQKTLITAVCLLVAACGSNTTERASTGALTGIGTGALIGGPVGAVVGGAVGGAGGAAAPMGADQATRRALGWEKREVSNATGIGAGSNQPQSTATLTVPKETVQQIQQELHARNDYDGPIDGAMGAKTHHGIRQYQQQEGLKVTGELDTPTLQRLTAAAENPQNGGASAPQPQ
jgi:hypothetical protein